MTEKTQGTVETLRRTTGERSRGFNNIERTNKMNPVFVDINIHTSDNPDNLNQNYDVNTLFANDP